MAETATTPKKATKRAPKASKTAPKGDKNAFAVISTGGKQYRVGAGETIKIEKLIGDYKEGDTITFESVLLSANGDEFKLGEPFLKGASVTGTITKIGRNKTIDVIKYKQKSRYFKKYGHRQPYFQVKIEEIK